MSILDAQPVISAEGFELPGILWLPDSLSGYQPSSFNEFAVTHQRFAMPVDQIPEVAGGISVKADDSLSAVRAFVQKYCPGNKASVPQSAGTTQNLLDIRLPAGSQYRIDGVLFDLQPAATFEFNYLWSIQINGQDLLNNGNTTASPGRPITQAFPVNLGLDSADAYIVDKGSRIQVFVQAVNTIVTTATIYCRLFGTLLPA